MIESHKGDVAHTPSAAESYHKLVEKQFVSQNELRAVLANLKEEGIEGPEIKHLEACLVLPQHGSWRTEALQEMMSGRIATVTVKEAGSYGGQRNSRGLTWENTVKEVSSDRLIERAFQKYAEEWRNILTLPAGHKYRVPTMKEFFESEGEDFQKLLFGKNSKKLEKRVYLDSMVILMNTALENEDVPRIQELVESVLAPCNKP